MLAASEGRALARLQRNAAQRRVTGCSLLHLAAQAQWPAARSLAAGRWRSPCLRDAVTRARAARRCRAVRYEVADASPSSALDGLPRSLTIVTGGSRGLGRRIAEALLTSGDPSTGHAAACPGGHDVLLLASNPSALNAAVADLAAAAAFGTLRAGGGGASGAGGAWGTGGGDSSSGGGVSTPKLRLRGIAVDLGDLDRLEGFSRALVTASAQGGLLPADPASYASVLLVHNAGQTGDLVFTWDQSAGNIRRQIDLNVTSPAVINAAVMRAFMGSPSCQEVTLVNISSVSWCRAYETFGVYGAGKAARHMLLVATPALEADMFHPPNRRAPNGGIPGDDNGGGGGGSRSDGGPRLRALSYAPGAIDTEMQAAAREALPRIPLKDAFESNAASGRLVDPADSARALAALLARPRREVANGSHWDYYDLVGSGGGSGGGGGVAEAQAAAAAEGGGAGAHPLDRPPALAVGRPAVAAASRDGVADG